MIIPYQSIPQETLRAVIESFISREGTDYGDIEHTLDDKVAQVMSQLSAGDVLISFDEVTETVTLLTREQWRLIQQQAQQQ